MRWPVLGTSDLTKDLAAGHTIDRLPLVTALGVALLAARAYRLAILDGVHLDLDDAAGLAPAPDPLRRDRAYGRGGWSGPRLG